MNNDKKMQGLKDKSYTPDVYNKNYGNINDEETATQKVERIQNMKTKLRGFDYEGVNLMPNENDNKVT